MLPAFALAFRQLGDRRFVWVLVKSVAVTLAIFAGVGGALYWAVTLADGAGEHSGMIAIAMLVLTIAAFWLAFRAVAIAVTGLFGDEIVHAVEARHYGPALVTARAVPFPRALMMGLRSAGRLIGYNLIATPMYLVLLATGVGLPVAFLGVNGWLLGRDLGDMVAVRHLDDQALRDWRARTRWPRFAVGLASAGLFAVPLVNLVAPIVGAAAMTHLFHRRRSI